MRKRIYTALVISLLCAGEVYASSLSLLIKGGYMPEMGGSMHSGWQSETLGVSNGINDINRSGSGISVSTINPPTGVVGGCEFRLAGDSVYFKSGADIAYAYAGGKGSTVNDFGGGDEKVEVQYSLWYFYVPATAGIIIDFWNEAKIYVGGGAAFAYGTYSNSFRAASVDYDASFTGYGFPLVAEVGCEYILSSHTSVNCGVTYLHGRSDVIETGSDYACIDFSGFSITAGLLFYLDFGGE